MTVACEARLFRFFFFGCANHYYGIDVSCHYFIYRMMIVKISLTKTSIAYWKKSRNIYLFILLYLHLPIFVLLTSIRYILPIFYNKRKLNLRKNSPFWRIILTEFLSYSQPPQKITRIIMNDYLGLRRYPPPLPISTHLMQAARFYLFNEGKLVQCTISFISRYHLLLQIIANSFEKRSLCFKD